MFKKTSRTIKKQNSLTNRVEYSIFHGKNKLNLSLVVQNPINLNYGQKNANTSNNGNIKKLKV